MKIQGVEKKLKKFELFLAREDRKNSTIKGHVKRLKNVLLVCSTLHYESFDEYIFKLKREGKTNNYLNNIIFAMRNYARMENMLGLQKYPQFKPNATSKATMSDEEIEAFLALTHENLNQAPKTTRFWTMFFSLLAYTGARPQEIRLLETKHVDFGRNLLIFEDTKTRETREVPIPHNLKADIKSYINGLKGDVLFYGRKNKHMDVTAWSNQFIRRIKILRIKRPNLSTYSLRHSYITEMLQQDGVNLFDVKELVGHRQTETTERYYHLTSKRKQEASKKHPAIKGTLSHSEQLNDIIKAVEKLDKTKFNIKIAQQNGGLDVSIIPRENT